MLRGFFLLIFSAAMLCVPAGFKRLTHGFRVTKLRVDVPFRPEWEFSSSKEEALQILQQPFFYLGRGTQCYVFASEDDQHVLKLFRYDQPLNPLRKLCHSWRKERPFKTPFREKVAFLLSACATAYCHGREETGLSYMHLNITQKQFPRVELHIPLGRIVRLPLDRYRFALQKKAETGREAFVRAYQQGDRERAKKLLGSLCELFQRRQAKGIWNLDLNFSRNFGFIEGEAIEIDFGSYIPSDERGLSRERREFSRQLSHFLATVVPEWKNLAEEL